MGMFQWCNRKIGWVVCNGDCYWCTRYSKEDTMTKLEIAKQVIKENIYDAECGIFDSRNIVGDEMETIYYKDGLQIDICYSWMYFEVFGLTQDEFDELEVFYALCLSEK